MPLTFKDLAEKIKLSHVELRAIVNKFTDSNRVTDKAKFGKFIQDTYHIVLTMDDVLTIVPERKKCKYLVSVERELYQTGKVLTIAQNPMDALLIVQRRLESGELEASTIDWGEPQCSDDSGPKLTGDVD